MLGDGSPCTICTTTESTDSMPMEETVCQIGFTVIGVIVIGTIIVWTLALYPLMRHLFSNKTV
jgi:hypothetical protein